MRSPSRLLVGGTLAFLACAPERPSSAAAPVSDPPTITSPTETVTPPTDPRIDADSDDWDALVCAAQNPLRWAHHRAPRRPTLAVEDGVVFVAHDYATAHVDLPDGGLRWLDAPSTRTVWRSLVAGDGVVLATLPEAPIALLLDLASGRRLERPVVRKVRAVEAIGAALAIDDGCTLEVIDPSTGAAAFAIDGLREPLADAKVCSRPARLVAADAASLTLLGWRDGRLQLVRVDRSRGAVVQAIDLNPDAALTLGPRSGVVLEIAEGGTRALRLAPEGPIERRWPAKPGEARPFRELYDAEGPPLLLLAIGRRWSAIDPITLADRWTIQSDAEVAILGETTTLRRESGGSLRPPELHLVDRARGATLARRRLPEGRSWRLVGALAVVEGHAGVAAMDPRSGAYQWALAGSVVGVHEGGVVSVRGSARPAPRRRRRRDWDPTAPRPPLRDAPRPRVRGRRGPLDPRRRRSPALAAYADDPAAAERLPDDPIVAFVSPCDDAPISLERFNRYGACHPPPADHVPFATGSADLSTAASADLDRLAARWRAAAKADLHGGWAIYLVRGRRTHDEPVELAERRAEAVREALRARGVPCSQIRAVGDPAAFSAEVAITWHEPVMCIL
ncbi:MAG: hypothetical protein R3B09_12320 [Nannocystaceae bacterium]